MREDSSGLLIDRLAASIVDESLPLKDVEKELRGCVAEVAVKKRGLGKREVANRCGVTEKSIDNYLKEARSNPKSPEREIHRLLQDGSLSLEEIYEAVRPVLCHGRHFTLDDAKRALEKLVRTGEAQELPGKRYAGSQRPTICNPLTVEAYRDLVDEKARDLDYIVLRQKEVTPADLQPKGTTRFSRVVGDANLIRIDFTVDVPEEDLPEFYEKLSGEIAKVTLKYEKKKGGTRVRVILGMRSVSVLLAAVLSIFLAGPVRAQAVAGPAAAPEATGAAGDSIGKAGQGRQDTWELDSRSSPSIGGGGDEGGPADPALGGGDPGEGSGSGAGDQDRRRLPLVYVRGDANLDRLVDVSDAVAILVHLTGGSRLICPRAADVDGDDRVSIVDPIRLIRYLFLPGQEPSEIGRSVEADGLEEAMTVLPCGASAA